MLDMIQRESASYMTNNQIEQLVKTENIMKGKPGKYANVVVGMEQDNIRVLKGKEDHSIIIGSTSSGKTRRQLLPYLLTVINAKDSFVVNDCKVEILPMMLPYAKAKGYEIVILDFKNPDRTQDLWNPLSICYDYYHNNKKSQAMRMVRNLALNLFETVKASKDKYWENAGVSVFCGACKLLMEICSKEQVSVKNIVLVVNELMQDMNLYLEKEDSPFGLRPTKKMKVYEGYFDTEEMKQTAEYQQLQVIIENAKDTRDCVMSIFRTALEPYATFDDVVHMVSGSNTFDIMEIGEKPTAVFLITSDSQKYADALVSTFFDQVYCALVSFADDKPDRQLPVTTHFVIDEFSSLAPIIDMQRKISMARSRGIRFLLVVQSLAALRAVYSKDVADNILTNAANWVYLNSGEIEFQRLIQERLGYIHMPSGREEYLVSLADLNNLTLGQALCIHRGKAFYVDLPDISEYKLPFEPLKFFCNSKNIERKSFVLFSLREFFYEKISKETGLSVETLKTGKESKEKTENSEMEKVLENKEKMPEILWTPEPFDIDQLFHSIDDKLEELEKKEERKKLKKEQKIMRKEVQKKIKRDTKKRSGKKKQQKNRKKKKSGNKS